MHSKLLPHLHLHLPHPPLTAPTASRTFSSGNTITALAPNPSSHFRNALLIPSGAGTGSTIVFKSVGPPDPDRKTTVHEGTNGRSSSEAPRMAYSWAKIRDARRRVCGVETSAEEVRGEGRGRDGRVEVGWIGVEGLGIILFFMAGLVRMEEKVLEG